MIVMMQKHVEISSKNFTKQNPLGLNIKSKKFCKFLNGLFSPINRMHRISLIFSGIIDFLNLYHRNESLAQG